MRLLPMDTTKAFMSHLLIKDTFHQLLLQEAKIVTGKAVTIDGHMQKSYYSKEELEEMGTAGQNIDYVSWESVKPLCYDLIKGKKLPLRFQITLVYPKEHISSLLSKYDIAMRPEHILGLYFNIKFENNALQLTTATSLSIFTIDPSLEDAWAKEVSAILKDIT